MRFLRRRPSAPVRPGRSRLDLMMVRAGLPLLGSEFLAISAGFSLLVFVIFALATLNPVTGFLAVLLFLAADFVFVQRRISKRLNNFQRQLADCLSLVANSLRAGFWGSFLFGALLPFGVFNHIIRKRQDLIVRQLPDVLDLLSISVQAGLSLDGAMRKVVERMEGPLIDEFRRMLRDTRMGMTRRRSMQLMAKRCDVQDVYLFVMSVVQSERLGASMSDTLVIQADNMRDLRRQRARTQAMKAPVKMVFPLVFCIFPAIFVVVLLPSLLSLKQTIG